MNIAVFIVSWIFFTLVFWFGTPKLIHAIRGQHPTPLPRVVDYAKIARMEIEVWGHTFPNTDSSIAAGLTSYSDYKTINEQNRKTNAEIEEKLLKEQAAWNVSSPMPDFPGNPNWTDEDGRPW